MFAKAFRLFVSSTFQDFGEERRLLQERVFPALEAHCAAQGFDFRAVDMRWGVNDDAQLNQRTVEICLGEVIEAKGYPAPNLLILIGDRYGWVPLPFAIARDEFEVVRSWLIAQGKSEALADLARVYALDENHLVPGGMPAASADLIGAYTLRSREDELSDLKSPVAWAPLEARLRAALQDAAQDLQANGQLRAAERGKYSLSLTEQEIRKGLDQLVAGDGAAAANSIAWVRTTEAGELPARTLADAVQRALPEGHALLADVPVEHGGYNQAFVDRITAKLIAAIDVRVTEFKACAEAVDFALQTERAIHENFAAERLRVFVGRDSNVSAIAAHLAGEAQHPLVLTGTSGSGKTALMARAAAGSKGPVVQRFVGGSAASANQRNLLISMIEDLAALSVTSLPAQWENDDNRFVNQVRDLISGLDQPVAIFIDALDQLRAPYRAAWLPAQLSPKVKLIVSVLDDEAFATERSIVQGLRGSLPAEAFLAIEPLTEKDGADILKGLQWDAQRSLTPDQEAFILERFRAAGASPLYLHIAFAIARRWRSTDDPRARGLAEDVAALIDQFLDELSSVHHHEPLLVRRALGLIEAGREGLSESEAIAVLSRDAEVMAVVSSERFGAHTKRLPDSVWVRLKRSLAALLVEKGIEGEPLISFFHRQVTEVVRARIYQPDRLALHRALARFFDEPSRAEGESLVVGRRALSELPYQLYSALERARLDAVLTDPAWIDRKVQQFRGAAEIVEDFDQFANPVDLQQSLIGRSLRLALGILRRDPRQAMTQLHGRLIKACERLDRLPFLDALLARAREDILIELRPALTPPGAELARLEGHRDAIRALVILPDGRLASGGCDRTIRLWQIGSEQEVACLEGPQSVSCLAMLPGGRLASGAGPGITIWDIGNEQARYESFATGPALPLVALQDGRLVGGGDRRISVWDSASGQELASFWDPHDGVQALAVLGDGRLISGGNDGTIRLWDIATQQETARLEGHREGVMSLAVLPNGHLASGGHDGTVRLWNLDSERELVSLQSNSNWLHALCPLPNGLLASAGVEIELWDIDQGRKVAELEGHDSLVYALAAMPDGRLASAGADNTIRLWDLSSVTETTRPDYQAGGKLALGDGHVVSASYRTIWLFDSNSGRELAQVETDHQYGIRAVAVLPDGRIATGGTDTIQVHEPESGRECARFGKSQGVQALTVLPDGNLASGGYSLGLWDPTRGTELARVRSGSYGVSALAVLSGGRLATCGGDGTIRVFDLANHRELASFDSKVSRPNRMVVLPDGRLVSGGEDGEIQMWDAAEARVVARFQAHHGKVSALAASLDGRLLSGGMDRTVRLWDLTRGCELARLEIDGTVVSLAALHGGRFLASDFLGRLHWLKGIEPRS